MATTSPTTSRQPRPDATPISTRQRILEIALELFTDRGYEKTSIRDIAERLGTTKAALYYHFKSKADILFELHLRLHEIGDRLLDELEALPDGATRLAAAPRLLDEVITAVNENRELMQLHRRNQNAFDDLSHSERHRDANHDLEHRIRRLLVSADVQPAVRVRLLCAVGAILNGLLDDALVEDIPHDERVTFVRATVADLLPAAP